MKLSFHFLSIKKGKCQRKKIIKVMGREGKEDERARIELGT